MEGSASDGPRISIVVACFNDGVYVRQMWQTLVEPEPVELVVVDDGSTDSESLRALKEISAHPLVQIIRQENQGPSAALRRAIAAATTPYVFILGADDLPAPGALPKLADALDRDPEAAFAYGDYITFGRYMGYRANPEWDAWLNTQGNYCSAMIMMRREIYHQVGGYRTRSRFEDWDLLLSLIDHGYGGVKVDCVSFFYRRHGRRVRRRFSQSRSSWRDEYELLKSSHPKTFERLDELEAHSRIPRRQRWVYKTIRLLRSLGPGSLIEEILEWTFRASQILYRSELTEARRALKARGVI